VRSQSSDFWRLLVRAVLFILPFVVLQLAELFILPIDAFTFRVWEALLARPYNYPGSFYPNSYVRKNREYGSFYRSGNPALVEYKSVEWFTDSFGFRNRPEIERRNRYDVVITGDSNIVGAFLDQKDILSEALSRRSKNVVYSYSGGFSIVSHFFGDPRFRDNNPDLLVVESKAGDWFETNGYQIIFEETPDGDLKFRDRSGDFRNCYDPSRNQFVERLHSRLLKAPMFHYVLSALRVEFKVVPKKLEKSMIGIRGMDQAARASGEETGWRLSSRYVANGKVEPLLDESKTAMRFRRVGPACYWQSEYFVSLNRDGSIKLRFEAKNSVLPSRHRIYIFEDGSYRPIGEIRCGADWRQYDIPVRTKPGSILEMRIVQDDTAQWLSLRNVHVIGGGPVPPKESRKEPASVPYVLPKGKNEAPVDPIYSASQTHKPGNPATGSARPANQSDNPFPRPHNFRRLDGSIRNLSDGEIYYYFYRAVKAMNNEARQRGIDFILVVLPDNYSPKLIPPIKQLRAEWVKIFAYQPQGDWPSGMDTGWFWQRTDEHWSEAAVRLTADEILRMWRGKLTENRPFSKELRAAYTSGFPSRVPVK